MTDRETLWDWDLDSLPEEPADGHEPRTEPIPVAEVEEGLTQAGSDAQVQEEFSYARPLVDRSVPSSAGTLTFKPPPPPWWRTRRGAITLLAAFSSAAVLATAALVFRSASPTEDVPGPSPTSAVPSSSDIPTPSGATPTLTNAPAPPPPPPPPAPPPPVEDSAPAITRQYPAPRSTEPDKPQIGVTRAPMSVAPDIRTPPPTNSAKVGENRGGGFW